MVEFVNSSTSPALQLLQNSSNSIGLEHLTTLLSEGVRKVIGFMSPNFTYCQNNCSGRGDCIDGTCFCEVHYSGGRCAEPNFPYFIAFATIFFFICAVSMIQLLICVKSEFSRMKQPSMLKACRITTQKMLYFLIFLASAIRGYYFSSPDHMSLNWASSLLSAYYPLLLTGASLIVCFWAEVFHINNLILDKPRFLSKSFIGFLIFNVITYSLLLSEFLLIQFYDNTVNKDYFTSLFNGCYALLLLIVVVFFLIYGVEMYFKVHGSFAQGTDAPTVNLSQLHQSRFGLVFQAALLLITVCFLISEVLGKFWKDKVAVLGRNWHDISFRIVELAVALWFPCVLWNCISPDQLWILNPRKILAKLEISTTSVQNAEGDSLLTNDGSKPMIVKGLGSTMSVKTTIPDCWICYDSDRKDAGCLIQPCGCKGDVSVVHHDCLKKWLIESVNTGENMQCKVCKQKYVLEEGRLWIGNGFTKKKWLQSVGLVTVMSGSSVGAYVACEFYNDAGIRLLAIGGAFLLVYICFRLLGFSAFTAYQRAKISAVKILGRKFSSSSFYREKVVTISGTKTTDVASPESLHPDVVLMPDKQAVEPH